MIELLEDEAPFLIDNPETSLHINNQHIIDILSAFSVNKISLDKVITYFNILIEIGNSFNILKDCVKNYSTINDFVSISDLNKILDNKKKGFICDEKGISYENTATFDDIKILKGEIFIPVIGFEQLYEISNYGRVKNINYMNTGKIKIVSQRKSNNHKGLRLTMFKDGKQTTHQVDTLVAKHFIENPNNCVRVKHIDDDPLNNHANNLIWIRAFKYDKYRLDEQYYDGEIYVDVKGYEGMYKISDYGNLLSINYAKTGKPKLMRNSINQEGYIENTLHKESKTFFERRHRLVAINFIPNQNNFPVVNHKDGNKLNNHIDNLEWCTDHGNCIHAMENDLVAYGEQNGMSKLTVDDIIEIRRKHGSGISNIEIAKQHGIYKSTVQKIVSKTTWKRVG